MTDDERQRRLAVLREYQQADHGVTEPDVAFLLDEIDRKDAVVRRMTEYEREVYELREFARLLYAYITHGGEFENEVPESAGVLARALGIVD